MSMPFRLQVPRAIYQAMLDQARAEQPNECCGLLAGVLQDGTPPIGRVLYRFPLINSAASPREYISDGKDLIRAFVKMRRRGIEHLAIYHSHPTSDAIPSRTDLERDSYPGVMQLIISLNGAEPSLRSWWLADDSFREAEWEVVDRGPLRTATQSLLVALAFLTVLPLRLRELPSADVVARSRVWYPAVAILLGAVVGGWTWLLGRLNAPLPGAFLVLLAWVGLTGALHIDGLCDLCDGLFGGRTPEDRLRILKDPHIGTFGLAGGVLLLLGKFAALHQVLTDRDGPWIVGAAVVVARCLTLFLAAGAAYPRPDGTGKLLVEATRWWEAGPAAMLALIVAIGAVGDVRGGGSFLAAFVAVTLLRLLCVRRLGGITGDCLGAGIEVAEIAFLLAAVLWLPGRPGA